MNQTKEESWTERYDRARQMNFLHLSLEQELVLSPGNAMDLCPEQITLERCTITKLIPKAMEVCVTTDAGQEWTINVDLSDPDRLYLGGVSYDHGLGYRYWAFLNERNFWSWREWREWYILTTHLNNYIAFTGCDVEELANERNLQIARILYDVLANGNLGPLRSVTFEPLSESQMQHQDE